MLNVTKKYAMELLSRLVYMNSTDFGTFIDTHTYIPTFLKKRIELKNK